MTTQSLLLYFFLSVALSTSAQPKHFTIELIHRDSPLSPLYNQQNTKTDRLNSAFLRSISRSRRFNHQTDLQSGLTDLADGEYFMSITFGTPPVKVFALADTGSDLIWVQCQKSYKLGTGTIFENKKSSTYKNEPCHSAYCDALSYRRGCDESRNVCNYKYGYGDGSHTNGDLASETISINSVPFPGIVFGCGYDNGGYFQRASSGIIGLGGGKLSLISQLGSSVSKKFSYCLSHKSTTMNGKSFINLGTSTIPSGLSKASPMILTPLVFNDETYYYLTLEAISVGETKIPYPGKSSNPKVGGNIVIDSGTPLTLLDAGFFDKFVAVVEKSITGAKRVSDPERLSRQYCFKGGKEKIGLPEITVHFTRADVRLSQINAFPNAETDTYCLSMGAMKITTNVPIYGTYAQLDFFVGYDLESKTVSFQRTDCSASL